MSLLNIVKEQGIVSIITILKEEMEHFEAMEKIEKLVCENTSYCIKELDGRGIIYKKKYINKEDYLYLKDKTQTELFNLIDCEFDIIYDIDIEKNINWGKIFMIMGDEIPDEIYKKHIGFQVNVCSY